MSPEYLTGYPEVIRGTIQYFWGFRTSWRKVLLPGTRGTAWLARNSIYLESL